MARRSPTNPRYQKYTGPEGKTRKSAAAAKPKSASSSSAAKASKRAASNSKSTSRSSALAMRNPDTAEFKMWRRQWWIALVVGLVLTAVSYALQRLMPGSSWGRVAQGTTLGLAYAAIGFAFWVDWKKMRPLRKEAYDLQRSGKAPKPVAEKPVKSEKASSKKDTDTTDSGSDAE